MWSRILLWAAGWQGKVAIGVLLFGLGLGIVWSYNHAITARQEAEEALKSTQESLELVTEQKTQLDNILVEKQKNEIKLRKELDQFKHRFNTIRTSDKSVNDWANTRIPDPVINLLQQSEVVH